MLLDLFFLLGSDTPPVAGLFHVVNDTRQAPGYFVASDTAPAPGLFAATDNRPAPGFISFSDDTTP